MDHEEEETELHQIQKLWMNAKDELARLRSTTRKHSRIIKEKDSKLKDMARLFEQRKLGIERVLAEAKGKESAFRKEIEAISEKLEDERKARRHEEEKINDMEFEIDNLSAGIATYKHSLEKIQGNHEHVLRQYAETKEQNKEVQERLEQSQRAHAEVLGKIMGFEDRVMEMDKERRENRRVMEELRDETAEAKRHAKNAEEDMKRAEKRLGEVESNLKEQLQRKSQKEEHLKQESSDLMQHANETRMAVMGLRGELESAAERESGWRKKCRALSVELSRAQHALKLKGLKHEEKNPGDWDTQKDAIDIDAFRQDFNTRVTVPRRGGDAYLNDIDYRESQDLRVSQGYKSRIQAMLPTRSSYPESRGKPRHPSSTNSYRKKPNHRVRFAADYDGGSTSNTGYSDVLEDLYADSREAKRITEIGRDYDSEKGSAYVRQDETNSRMIEEFDEWLRS